MLLTDRNMFALCNKNKTMGLFQGLKIVSYLCIIIIKQWVCFRDWRLFLIKQCVVCCLQSDPLHFWVTHFRLYLRVLTWCALLIISILLLSITLFLFVSNRINKMCHNEEKFENIKVVIGIRKSKDRHYSWKNKNSLIEKGQTMTQK